MDDVVIHDLKTFPQEDPRAAALRKKEIKQHDKEHKLPSSKAFSLATKRTLVEGAAKKAGGLPEMALLRRKVTLYYEKLGSKISHKRPKTLPRDVQKLRELKEIIEAELNSAGGIEQAKAGYLTSVGLLEQFSPLLPFDFRCQGLTKVVQDNQEVWNDMLVQFSIEHAEWFMMGEFSLFGSFVIIGHGRRSHGCNFGQLWRRSGGSWVNPLVPGVDRPGSFMLADGVGWHFFCY